MAWLGLGHCFLGGLGPNELALSRLHMFALLIFDLFSRKNDDECGHTGTQQNGMELNGGRKEGRMDDGRGDGRATDGRLGWELG
jgi:hypothetical protein